MLLPKADGKTIRRKQYLKDTNTLTIKVKNQINIEYPFGKQSHNPGGMWYTKTTGIWQTVWLESVAKDYIKNITLNPLGNSGIG